MAGNDRMRPADEVLALAVASGESIVAAARLVGTSERTARGAPPIPRSVAGWMSCDRRLRMRPSAS